MSDEVATKTEAAANTIVSERRRPIMWKKEERQAVLAAFHVLCEKYEVRPARTVILQLALDAQNVIPENRRRPISTLTDFPELNKYADGRWPPSNTVAVDPSHRGSKKEGRATVSAINSIAAAHAAAKPSPMMKNSLQEKQITQNIAPPMVAPPLVELPAPAKTANDSIVDLIYGEIVARLVRDGVFVLTNNLPAAVAEAMHESIATQCTTQSPSLEIFAPTAKQPARARMPKVVIVGLISAQMSVIAAEFGQALDLVFHGTEEKNQLLTSRLAHADVCYALVGFMNHPLSAVIKKSNIEFHNVNGGVSNLRTLLTGFINNLKAKGNQQ